MEWSCSTTVGSTGFWQGRENRSHQWWKNQRLLCLPRLTCARTGHEHTPVHLGSKLHSEVDSGAWVGRIRHRGVSAFSRDFWHGGMKKPTSFSGKERQFRQVEMLLLWTVCCKDLQSKEKLQCTFEQVIYPGTDGKADESLKLWGSDHARNKLFSRRKVPEDVTSWSVILNKKKKIRVCSSWLSFSKIFLIIVPVWSEIRKYQNIFLFRFDSAPSPKQT